MALSTESSFFFIEYDRQASEVNETLSGMYKFEPLWYTYICVDICVPNRDGHKSPTILEKNCRDQ